MDTHEGHTEIQEEEEEEEVHHHPHHLQVKDHLGDDNHGRFYCCLIVKQRHGSQVQLRLYTTLGS